MRFLDQIIPDDPRAGVMDNWGPFSEWETLNVGGNTYTLPVQTTMPGQKAEKIANNFTGFALGGLMGNGVIFGLASVRMRVFSEARFQFQNFNNGRPGDLYGSPDLAILEHPWPGGTTGDLLAQVLLHADFAGNAYIAHIGGQLVLLRPDWVEIILGDRAYIDAAGRAGVVGLEKLGYRYWHGGMDSGRAPMVFLADEVAHFAPQPDPLAWYRGMSWLTPIIREIMADGAATTHKLKFFENAATPNLAVSLKDVTDPKKFAAFVDKMDEGHKNSLNAYKTMYLAGGADVTVVGTDLRQLDFKAVQGFGETRLAQAAGVPPTVAFLAEGLQGSALNAGNFGQARRQFADTTMSNLWRNISGSLEVLVPPPSPASRLWHDTRDIPFLREDQRDQSDIQAKQAQAVRTLVEAGYEPVSVVAAITNNDLDLLRHTGLYSIQLQEPMSGQPPEQESAEPADEPGRHLLDLAGLVDLLRPAPVERRVTHVERDDFGRVTRTITE